MKLRVKLKQWSNKGKHLCSRMGKEGVLIVPGTTQYLNFSNVLKKQRLPVQQQSNDDTDAGTEIVSMTSLKCQAKDWKIQMVMLLDFLLMGWTTYLKWESYQCRITYFASFQLKATQRLQLREIFLATTIIHPSDKWKVKFFQGRLCLCTFQWSERCNNLSPTFQTITVTHIQAFQILRPVRGTHKVSLDHG